MESLTRQKMHQALAALDLLLNSNVTLIVGGGCAMLMAHNFPLATSDIDAVPKGLTREELAPLIEKVAAELGLPNDWLNPWYQTFTYVLPADYAKRLINIFSGLHLKAEALGKEDLLVMKCFAHRPKDIAHARALIRENADLDLVFARIEELKKRKIPEAAKAEDFLNEVLDMDGK